MMLLDQANLWAGGVAELASGADAEESTKEDVAGKAVITLKSFLDCLKPQ